MHWADAELCTPLHAAARGGYVSVIKLLLKSGAAVNVSDLKGDTPAHLAARRGRFEAVTQLLRAGPPGLLEERNDRGETVQQLLSSSIARQETQRHLRQEHAREESRRKRRRADSEGSSWEGSEDDEEAWQRRLEREMSPDDYYGAYFDPGMWHGDEYETADDYARRIWEELERKKSRAAAAEPIGASAQKRCVACYLVLI